MKKIQRLWLIFFLLSVTILVAIAYKSALKEFQPAKDSLFKITFSYPASWNWEKDRPYDELHPGEVPPPSERIVLKNESISIQVYKPSNPQAKMQEWMDAYLGAVAVMLRADTTFEIGGYNARWLTVVYPPQNTSEGDVDEGIYLLAEDRFYILDLHIPESEINGRLDKEFRELIKTIKILP